jgi:ribonuclease VapC
VSNVVLDASALIAVLRNERGSELVAPMLYGATISALNYSEVFKKVVERSGDPQEVKALLDRQALDIIPFDAKRALSTAILLSRTSLHGLSFADRACLATAEEFGYPVLTAEERMTKPLLSITVTLIRSRNH